jgi:transposase-like protein
VATTRRSRAVWADLVAEVERSGGSVARTARRHDVNPRTLAWWRWTLRRAEPPTPAARLLPVVVASVAGAEPHLQHPLVEISFGGDVSLLVPIGSDVGYVAALVEAMRATC